MQRAYRALETGIDSPEGKAVMVDEKNCRFGKWLLLDEGGKRYGHLPSFSAIDEPHYIVHHSVHHAVHLAAQAWQQDVTLQREIVTTMHQAEEGSQRLMETMAALIEEKVKYELPGDDNTQG
ncbi:MAG: CZB domain-containing protein [Candidatus Polarisedimenticolaceae bacterium]|nr:CZB domain-containing protein [Candidatus Polarisedimenticolaceae bacterium]